MSGALAVVLLASLFMPAAYNNRLDWAIFFLIAGGLAVVAAALMASEIRSRLFEMAGHYLSPNQAS
jgi:hypothetical protein